MVSRALGYPGPVTRCLLAALTLLGGCDLVFGLTRTPPPDAAPDAPFDAAACVDPTHHDEDGDGVEDGCDNCPHVAQTSFDDDDQDGVGDGCDPDPGRRDTQLQFFGFATPPRDLVLAADLGTGMWSLAGDALRLSNGQQDKDYSALLPELPRDSIIDTAFTIIAAPTVISGHSQSAGVWLGVDPASPSATFPAGNVFENVSVPVKNFLHITQTSHLPANTVESSASPELFVVGRRYRVRFACQGQTNPTCTGSVTYGVNDTTTTISLASSDTRIGSAGLRVHGDLTVAFDYLVIYRGPE